MSKGFSATNLHRFPIFQRNPANRANGIAGTAALLGNSRRTIANQIKKRTGVITTRVVYDKTLE